MKNENVLITGGAGFIGSHIADFLKGENRVFVYDDFSNSAIQERSNEVTYYFKDILDFSALKGRASNIDIIFHLASFTSVEKSKEYPRQTFEQNLEGSLNVLEAARKNDISRVVFASSSTVYGEAEIPTPETAPLKPISNYGAAKAGCEMLLNSYSFTYGIQTISLRYSNIYGPRSHHGVMYDFFHKLKRNPESLEILGDGKQKKSYLYIDDCVRATITSLKSDNDFDSFNVGSSKNTTVDRIAEIISNEMGLDPKFEYTGGIRGWEGDVPEMLLDVSKIKSLGWESEIPIEEGIPKYIRWLSENS